MANPCTAYKALTPMNPPVNPPAKVATDKTRTTMAGTQPSWAESWRPLFKLFAVGTLIGMILLVVLEAIGESAIGLNELQSDLLAIVLTAAFMAATLLFLKLDGTGTNVRSGSDPVGPSALRAGLHGAGPLSFSFVYQPKLDLRNGKLAGLEVLARWSIDGGPARSIEPLIPMLERSGMVRNLTKLAITAALEILNELEKKHPGLWVSVNVSARDLDNHQFLVDLNNLTRSKNIKPASIVLEITETSAMSRSAKTRENLFALRRAGFRIVMDDFGTGYSSLMELQRMPFHAVKIDRAFVMEMLTNHTSHTLVETMILLGHRLGMEVVAEGIEDSQTVHALRSLGADYGQGYYFARPLSDEALITWIDELVIGGVLPKQSPFATSVNKWPPNLGLSEVNGEADEISAKLHIIGS